MNDAFMTLTHDMDCLLKAIKNRAFIVVGPESSGTFLITKLLIDAGCFGDGGMQQRLDLPNGGTECLNATMLPADGSPIVWRRDLCSRAIWPNLAVMVEQLRKYHYEPTIIVVVRDWWPIAMTQRRQMISDDIEYDHKMFMVSTGDAYRRIFATMPETVKFIMASYESIITNKWAAVDKLFSMIGLTKTKLISHLADENAAWFSQEFLDGLSE